MKIHYLFFISIFLVSSCTNGWFETYESLMAPAISAKLAHPEILEFDGELEPPLPDPIENKKTVAGIDVNKNGVRDDVEIYINRTYDNPNIRMALKQYIREHSAFQDPGFIYQEKTAEQGMATTMKTLACLEFVSPFNQHEIIRNLSKVFNNEKFRDDVFGRSLIVIGSGLDPSVSTSDYLNYDKFCRFPIKDYAKTRENFLKVWK